MNAQRQEMVQRTWGNNGRHMVGDKVSIGRPGMWAGNVVVEVLVG